MGIVASRSEGAREFDPCPEYEGRAVCVDVTPLKEYQTSYGPKMKFKFVFEIDLIDDSRKPPQPWVVMSMPMTASLGDRSALGKLLKGWFGRALTDKETSSLDLDSLIGRSAKITVIHEQSDDGTKTYANIGLLRPHAAGDPLLPSGKWVRLQDRPAKGDGAAGGGGAGGSSYRRTAGSSGGGGDDQPAADPSCTKVHVGKNKGLELRELTEDAIGALIEHWLPTAKANPKPTADDKRLMAGLHWYADRQKAAEVAAQTTEAADDDVPF
jgi:hypothetical protein